MKKLGRGTLCAAVAVLAGCGTGAGTVRPGGGPAVLKDSAVVVRFSEQGMHSERMDLRRQARGLEGEVERKPVALQWDDKTVKGTYRSLPVALTVRADGEGHLAQGEFDGEAAAFRFSQKAVEGYLGACALKVERRPDGSFFGARQCDAAAEPMVLVLPSELWSRAPTERAAWLAVLVSEYASTTRSRSISQPSVLMSAERDRNLRSRSCIMRETAAR